jgi:hypothetical protein
MLSMEHLCLNNPHTYISILEVTYLKVVNAVINLMHNCQLCKNFLICIVFELYWWYEN